MTVNSKRICRILHVEDNPGDVRLIREALKETGRASEVNVAYDGAIALDYLYGRGVHVNASRPDLILLDLNLPKMSGREVLAEIKADPDLKNIPVVVFTSSSAPPDVDHAYDCHVNCYVTKPSDVDDIFRVIGSIEKFWLDIARLPPSRGQQ